jgi:hypothetical protein
MPYEADRCLIGRAENVCRECGGVGRVACVVLPHDVRPLTDDDSLCVLGAQKARYIESLNDELLAAIGGASFRPEPSRTAGITYYGNHCEHCDALQGDWYLHGPDGPFWPETWDGPPVIVEPFEHPVRLQAALGGVTFDLGAWSASYGGNDNDQRSPSTAGRQ